MRKMLLCVLVLSAAAAAPADPPASQPAPPPATPKLNLIPNSGFETAVSEKDSYAAGWTRGRPAKQKIGRVETDPRQGQYCLRVDNGNETVHGGFVQSETIVLNQTEPQPLLIEASARIEHPRTGGKGGMGFSAFLDCDYAAGPRERILYNFVPAGAFDPTASGWQDVSFLWKPPYPVKSCRLSLAWFAPGVAYFDKVRLARWDDVLDTALNDPDDLDADLAGRWGSVELSADFNDGKIPPALIRHIGDWKLADGKLATEGELPPCGAILRSRDVYLPQSMKLRYRLADPAGAMMLVIGPWKIAVYADHVGVRNLWPPLSKYPIVRPADARAGVWHDLNVALREYGLTLTLDGKEVVHFTPDAAPELKEARPRFVNMDSWFAVQAYNSPQQPGRDRRAALRRHPHRQSRGL